MVGGHHPLRVTASGPVTADNPARSQTERAFTRTLRVAAVLALTEERSVMTADDLDCALAFVNYSIASARYVIGAHRQDRGRAIPGGDPGSRLHVGKPVSKG